LSADINAAPATPAAEANPTTPTPAKPPTAKERKASAVAELRTKLAESRNRAPVASASQPAPAPQTEAATAVADAIEAAGGEAPEQREGESNKQYELRLAQALRKLETAQADARKARKDHELSAGELKKLQALVAKGKAPEPVLEAIQEAFGYDLESLVKGVHEGRLKVPGRQPKVDPEIQAKLDRLEQVERERQAERERTTFEATKRQHTEQVAGFLTENATEYPVLAATGAAASLVDAAYAKGGQANVAELAAEAEAQATAFIVSALSKPGVLQALVKQNDSLGSVIASVMGASSKKPASASNGEAKPGAHKALSSLPTETPTTPAHMSARERKAYAVAQLNSRFKGK